MNEAEKAVTFQRELLDSFEGRVLFWTCPNGCNKEVVWNHRAEPPIARCSACKETNRGYKTNQRIVQTLAGRIKELEGFLADVIEADKVRHEECEHRSESLIFLAGKAATLL